MQCSSTTTTSPIWEQSTDRMIHTMTQYTPDGNMHNIEYAGGLGIVGTPIHEHPPGIPEDFINVDLFQQTDPLKGHEQPTQEYHDFFSSISSALSEGSASPSTSEIMSTTSFPFPYAAQHSGSTSSSSSVCSFLALASPYTHVSALDITVTSSRVPYRSVHKP